MLRSHLMKQPQRTWTSLYRLAEECLVTHGIRGADGALKEFEKRARARYRRAIHGDRETYMDDAVFIFSEAKTVMAEKLAES